MTNSTSKPIYDFNPNNLPSEYLRAIGLITAVAAQTESIIQQFIGALLKIDNIQNVALTRHMSIPLMMDIVKTLAEIQAPNIREIDKIDELMEEAKTAMDKRNLVVHNPLVINPETNEILMYRLTARGSIKQELKSITVAEIEKDAAVIYDAGIAIMDFMISRGLELPMRTTPLNPPSKRGKKARSERVSK